MSIENHSSERQQSRERLDRCLGCHFGDSNKVRPATASALMSCAQVSSTGARLRKLRSQGIVTASDVEGEWPRQLYYVPTNTPEAKAYVDTLPKGPCMMRNVGEDTLPQVLGFDTTTTATEIAEANAAAEALLIEKSDLKIATLLRRRMLGCVACKLFRRSDAIVTSHNLSRCTGASIEAAMALLETAKDASLLTTTDAVRSQRRQEYQSANTELGRAFTDLLTPPVACALDTAQQLRQQAEAEVPPLFNGMTAYPQLPEPLE